MGLLRRASVAAGGNPLHPPDHGVGHDDSLAAAPAGTSTATDPEQQFHHYLTRRPSDIVRWRDEMEHSPSSSSILPGFRGLWQSQGKVLMLFAASLAALVYYVSLVSADISFFRRRGGVTWEEREGEDGD